MSRNFWDEYEQADREESGGGGVICQARITTGYKCYAEGLSQEETFFEANASDKTARAKAKAAAVAQAADYGAGRARWSVCIKALKTGEWKGEPWNAIRVIDGEWKSVTWQDDRWFIVNTWTQACKEVVIPSLKEAGIAALPATIWARIGFQNDPYKEAKGKAGMTDEDQDGNPRFPQIAYIVEAFESLEAAQEAIGLAKMPAGDEAEANYPALPADWEGALPTEAETVEAWLGELKEIEAEYPGPMPKVRKALEADAEKLAEKHACTPEEALAWWGEL